jgi:hypothetical protein
MNMDVTSTDVDDIFNFYFFHESLKDYLKDAIFEYQFNKQNAIYIIYQSFHKLKYIVNRSYKPIWYVLNTYDSKLAEELLEIAIDQKAKFEEWA